MKIIPATFDSVTTRIRRALERNRCRIAVVSIVCFVAGVIIARQVKPGVRVHTVIVAGDTPALEYLPADPGPHPVALLGHGFGGSKEDIPCYAEALAGAGFVCYAVDQHGHGASPRLFSLVEAARKLGEVADAIGPVDVFLGHSMGGITGGEAVREGLMRPNLFIALGSNPRLGESPSPLLMLAGRFDEFLPPSELRARTDARLVLSPWSDHLFETFDPLLIHAAVEASCAAVGRTPTHSSDWWLWRLGQLGGIVLALFGAVTLALRLPEGLPPLARVRGALVAAGFIAAGVLTTGIDSTFQPRRFLLQIAGIGVMYLVLRGAHRLRIPRWSSLVIAALVMGAATLWVSETRTYPAVRAGYFALAFSPALVTGTILGGLAARRGTPVQGDIAMAIIAGCSLFHQRQLPKTAAQAPKPHIVVMLSTSQLDACVGRYEFPPDNVFRSGARVTIWRQGDRLAGQWLGSRTLAGVVDICPESETNFFIKLDDDAHLTFIRNDKGAVTAVIRYVSGLPDSEGRRLKE